MGWLDFFKRKSTTPAGITEAPDVGLDELLGSFPVEDYLGKAAEAGLNRPGFCRHPEASN